MSRRTTEERFERRFFRRQRVIEVAAGLPLDESISRLATGIESALMALGNPTRRTRDQRKLIARRHLAEHGSGIHRMADYADWRFVGRLAGQPVCMALMGVNIDQLHRQLIDAQATRDAFATFPVKLIILPCDDTDDFKTLGIEPRELDNEFHEWLTARAEELAGSGAIPRPAPRAQVHWNTARGTAPFIQVWLDVPEFTRDHAERMARALGAKVDISAEVR